MFGDAGDDELVGGVGNNEEHGGAGDDTLIAGEIGGAESSRVDGNSTLFGDEGNDHLIGGTGADQLTGGTGDDTLTGGLGSDTFIFNTASEGVEHDTITDFQSGQDVVDLNGVGADFDVAAHLTQTEAGALLDTGTGQQILFANETVDQIHATDFHLA